MLHPSFLDAMSAPGPAADRTAGLQLYAFLVGSWTFDARFPQPDGKALRSRGEIPAPYEFYGSTLRIYDPGLDAWHILWSDPMRQLYRRQLGRAEGPDIVQLGKDDAGAPVRWSFRDRTKDSFLWLGEHSPDGGKSWILIAEFHARRETPV